MGLLVLVVGGVSDRRAAGASDREPTVATPLPTRWLASEGKSCKAVRRKGEVCDGPRRTPEPHGSAALLAEELGLGTRKAAQRLMRAAPRRRWVEAIEADEQPTLLWPVESGSFGRGFDYTRTGSSKALRHDGVDDRRQCSR